MWFELWIYWRQLWWIKSQGICKKWFGKFSLGYEGVRRGISPYSFLLFHWPLSLSKFIYCHNKNNSLSLMPDCLRFLGVWLPNSKAVAVVSCLIMPDSLRPHGLQHARLPCPSPSPRACSDVCPLSRWSHPTVLSSVVTFSCLQSFPASGSFSNESALRIRWPKYWSFSFSISPSSEYSGLKSNLTILDNGYDDGSPPDTPKQHHPTWKLPKATEDKLGNSPIQTSIKKRAKYSEKWKRKNLRFHLLHSCHCQMGQGEMVPVPMPMIKLECGYTFAAITQHEYFHLKRSLKFQSTVWPYFLLWSCYKMVNNG